MSKNELSCRRLVALLSLVLLVLCAGCVTNAAPCPPDPGPPSPPPTATTDAPPAPALTCPATSDRFCMAIQDFFAISGRDPVVTGHVDTGSVRVGDQLVVRRSGAADVEVVATAIEMFRKGTDQAFAGDNIGLYVQLSSKNPRELLQRGGLVVGAKSSPSTPPAATIEYVVWMESAGGSKINVIKAVRELTGLSLKDAKDLVEKAPVKVLATMVKADAESAKAKLEAAGATVTLKELPK